MLSAGRLLLVSSISLVLAPAELPAPPATEIDPLVGIWAYATTFGPTPPGKPPGELTVTRRGKSWDATLGGSTATFTVTGDDVRFAFAADVGKFRGKLVDGGKAIDGFWLRPGVTADPRYPGGSSQTFATPLVLRASGPASWRGTVRPLADPFTLYLRIFRDDAGTFLAAFRNPEQNSHGPAMQFRVAREGAAVRFTAGGDPGHPEVRLDATLATDPERLQLFWTDLGRSVDLTRRTPAEAAASFPRPPDAAKCTYRAPPSENDGWPAARASEAGLDEAALARLVQRLSDADPAARRPSLIHSLLVARRGKLVLEEYFFGFDRDTPHDLRSAGKTFASVMLGTAMQRGVKVGPETRVYELLGGIEKFAHPDPRKARITLAHLMTHSAGLACNDEDDDSPGNESAMQRQTGQPDWWRYTLDLPMTHDPGTRYAYCSANMNLVGGALSVATATWLPEWFDRTIARPLQFGPYHWNLMPNDGGYLGGGAFLRPRDFLKLGQTYLDGGVWRGRRIVAASWVAQSSAPHFHVSPTTTGLAAAEFADSYAEGDDGYAWHLGGVRSGDRKYAGYAATGNGGQLLLVIPELELVVVLTGGNYRQGGIWGHWADEIVGGEIIPAIRR